MLVSKLRSRTSKTKAGPGGLAPVALFWKSHCATCSPACVFLYRVTGSCKGPIVLLFLSGIFGHKINWKLKLSEISFPSCFNLAKVRISYNWHYRKLFQISFFLQSNLNSYILLSTSSRSLRWQLTEACHNLEIWQKPYLEFRLRDIKVRSQFQTE